MCNTYNHIVSQTINFIDSTICVFSTYSAQMYYREYLNTSTVTMPDPATSDCHPQWLRAAMGHQLMNQFEPRGTATPSGLGLKFRSLDLAVTSSWDTVGRNTWGVR